MSPASQKDESHIYRVSSLKEAQEYVTKFGGLIDQDSQGWKVTKLSQEEPLLSYNFMPTPTQS